MTARTEVPPGHDRGFILVTTLLLLVLLLTLGAAATVYSVYDLKSTSQYKTGNDAFYAAEAGLLHGLNAMNGVGVANYNYDIVQRWSSVFSPNPRSIPGFAIMTYQVSVSADATDPINKGTITAVGFGPNNSRRTVLAKLLKNGTGRGLGALYLASDTVNTSFSGNAFDINGNNHDQFGNLVSGGPVEPGIATRNDTATSSVVNSLNTNQKSDVQGTGFSLSPLTPSVMTAAGPSVSDLNRIASEILANASTYSTNVTDLSGNMTLGTVGSPQITELTASQVKVHANGNVSGAGILIVDGSITINGNFDFTGWIIVKGSTVINDGTETDITGNATIEGSLWSGDVAVNVGGSAIVNYCQYCMSLVDQVPGATGYFPKAMTVVSWQEVY
jgi:PilX N-terminal